MHEKYLQDFGFSKFIFSNRKMALFWLLVRVYVGYEWITAGWDKLHDPVWVGSNAGGALAGFIQGALTKTVGAHPDVSLWYASFLKNVVLPNVQTWSHVIAFGEFLVGLALIIGFLTGLAAFFGMFMNLNFLLAGTVSINPVLLMLSIGVVLAWRIAGYWGLDRYVLPKVINSTS